MKTALTRKVSAVSFCTSASFNVAEWKSSQTGDHNAKSGRIEL
jgi:hypothetical protein